MESRLICGQVKFVLLELIAISQLQVLSLCLKTENILRTGLTKIPHKPSTYVTSNSPSPEPLQRSVYRKHG